MEDTRATGVTRIPPEKLFRPADLSALAFTTTADLAPTTELFGQDRARDALDLGVAIAERGFNIFAIGASPAEIRDAVGAVIEASVATRPAPPDRVYVNNFAASNRPRAIALPAARAPEFEAAVRRLTEEVRNTLPTVFENEDYQTRRSAIEEGIRSENEKAFQALGEKATARGTVILRTPSGFAVAPSEGGKVVPPDDFNAWPEERRAQSQAAIKEIERELEQTLRTIPRIDRERREAVKALDREVAEAALAPIIEDARAPFSELPEVLAHFDAIRADLLENVALFASGSGDAEAGTAVMRRALLERYGVNVLVSAPAPDTHAPFVEELHPTLANLIGRVEYVSQQGTLVTNFRLIKGGSLHRANGGAILIDARSLLTEPFSWPALKRALLRNEILIEDAGRFLGLAMTVSLEPDPIPLNVKVVLFGERRLYYLLSALDPDFPALFKILADFEDDAPRTPETEAAMTRLIAGVARDAKLLPFARAAVARLIEHAARLAEDSSKLTLLLGRLRNLMAEASHHARAAERAVVHRDDVAAAIQSQIRRAARIEDRSREMILRDIALISTSGVRTGQVNGLSVLSLGEHAFGRPSRITCRVRPGSGKIVDIEREVELGGPLHSKGVLILSGFLVGRYALDEPMSLYASLVFEQSYGGIDGDSASSAELYALLSAIGELPLRQELAVTGSVNQHGVIQAIGGVNEKIEGFFDICAARGLRGTEGVLIPAANVAHLMLRDDVVAAAREHRFSIYPIHTIDEGIALLAGRPAGERGRDGTWPEGSVNRAVEDRLKAFAAIRRSYAKAGGGVNEHGVTPTNPL